MRSEAANNHVSFESCIEAFRPTKEIPEYGRGWVSESYILTDFKLLEPWALPNCTIHPSTKISITGTHSAFISKVEIHTERQKNFLFNIALASIITFATGRVCRAHRNEYFMVHEGFKDESHLELALTHPIITCGPGTQCNLPENILATHANNVSSLINKLLSLPPKKYNEAMQAIRLVHLSASSQKDDFGLSYLLIVVAIESASKAEAGKPKRHQHPKETEWNTKPELHELLKAYQDASSKNYDLKKRYVDFILKYAPITEWEQAVPDPNEHITSLTTYKLTKRDSDIYPEELTEELIAKLLGDSYSHRSGYVHQGQQPPHKEIGFTSTRFFEIEYGVLGNNYTTAIRPTYEALKGLAKYSITKWINTIQ